MLNANKKSHINEICKLFNFALLSKTKPHAQVTHSFVFLASDVVNFYYVCILLLDLLLVSDRNVAMF